MKTVKSMVSVFVFLTGWSVFASPEVSKDRGLTVISEPRPGSFLTKVQVVIRSGSISDPSGKAGLSQLTASSLLHGTRTQSREELMRGITRLGGDLDVYTDYETTRITGSVLAENTREFLGILNQVVTEPRFDDADLEVARQIQLGRAVSSVDPVNQAAEIMMMKALYRGTPAEFPTWGTVASITGISRPDLVTFFESHYVRENMIIGVSAPFVREEIESMVGSAFSQVPMGARDEAQMPPPAIHGRRAMILNRENVSAPYFYVSIPGIADPEPDLLALNVADMIFGADYTSVLNQVLRVENGWTYGAYGVFWGIPSGPSRTPGTFDVFAYPSAEFVNQAITKAVELLDAFARDGVTEAQFNSRRSALDLSDAFRLASSGKRLSAKIREVISGRPYQTVEEARSILRALSLEDVNRAIHAHLNTSNLLIGVVGDAATLQPALMAIPGIEAVEVIAPLEP